MTFRDMEKIIKKDEWELSTIQGSHHHYRHPLKTGKVTIPKHGGDLNPKLVNSILKQAGLK